MVARHLRCERAQLELAVADRLDDRQAEQLSQHLDICPHCRSELEELAGSAEWWHHARTYLSSTDDLDATNDDSPQAEELVLDFLEPADDPSLLGRLGTYEVESVIGRGGMGVVLKARDSALARGVAIKVLASPLATRAAARKRFAREARAAAAVVHDHVIPIYAVDTSGRVPFLVMPLVTGRSLQDRLDATGPLEVKEILRIAIQTARGLAAAHAQGLVHRDIKPANILFESNVERIRITDFGLARAIDDASQTQSGFIAGTPQYMSPEQARGDAVDARADLFSLGSVIYAMCVGHPPFRAETTLAVLRRICDDSPRPIREINPDVPAWLAAIVHKLLAKAPGERFQSTADVADLLERWLAHLQQPTVVAPPAFYASKSPSQVRARLIAAAGSLALSFFGALVIWQWQPARTGPGASNPSQPASRPSLSVEQLQPQPAIAAAAESPMSAQAVDAELQRLGQATGALEVDLVFRAPTSFSAEQNLGELQWRLFVLEQELAASRSPCVLPAPAQKPPSDTITNP